MPLSNKTILDSHCFVHELKTEMHDDLEYVKSLEKEIDELESEKADFSNIYDLLLEECVSKDVTCSYLHSLSDLNANTELQCLYLHKVKECECLAQKLSKQTESVNNEVHNKLLKSFAKLEKHSISLELSLQHCKEQMKNNPVCKENASNVFRKEREQYHEIQDLKAQMQDKNIAISELKKLIENCKGKSVETQFNKPSVVRQPNAQRIPKPSVLGKPTPFSNSPEMRSFQTKQSVNKTNVSDGLFKQVTQQNLPQIRKQAVRNTNVIAPGPSRNCPKHVSHQSPREKVGSNDMVHNYYLEKAKKSAQLQKDKEVNGKPSMIDPARLPNTANGCKPKPRNWQASMSSRVSNKDVHLGEHRKQKPFLKFNDNIIELTLEQSQQGVSNDVLETSQYIAVQITSRIADIENDIMDPVMQCTTLLSHSGFSQQKLVSFVTEIHTLSIDISLRDSYDIELVANTQAFEYLKPKCTNLF
ncbi:hypothetical protein Tco_0154082 [Tanacetum coccineum]